MPQIILLLLTILSFEAHALDRYNFETLLNNTPVEDINQKIILDISISQNPNGPVVTLTNQSRQTYRSIPQVGAKNSCVHNLLGFIESQRKSDYPLVKEIERIIGDNKEKFLRFSLSLSVPENSKDIDFQWARIDVGNVHNKAAQQFDSIASAPCTADQFQTTLLENVRKYGATTFGVSPEPLAPMAPKDNLYRAIFSR